MFKKICRKIDLWLAVDSLLDGNSPNLKDYDGEFRAEVKKRYYLKLNKKVAQDLASWFISRQELFNWLDVQLNRNDGFALIQLELVVSYPKDLDYNRLVADSALKKSQKSRAFKRLQAYCLARKAICNFYEDFRLFERVGYWRMKIL